VVASSAAAEYVAFEAWGLSLQRSPIGASIAKLQAAYTAQYGYTGHDAPTLPEDPKAKPATAAATEKKK